MQRTQIQFPDRLYQRLKARALEEETSLAELMRKAGEYYLSIHPGSASDTPFWTLPSPRDLGDFLVPEEQWRELANDAEALP